MLKVYMTGLVYVYGCDSSAPIALLPDGTGNHYASLWVDETQLQSASWPPAFVKEYDLEVQAPGDPTQTVHVFEFRIPAPGATVTFPTEATSSAQCWTLGDHLPKLKVNGPGGPTPFPAVPELAETVAQAPIRSGVVNAYKFTNIGVIDWTIASPVGLHVAVDVDGETHAITLQAPAAGAPAEIVLTNIHDVSDKKKGGNHFKLFKKLNPTVSGNLAASGQPGSAPELSDFESAFLKFFKKEIHIAGETPHCCTG